MTVIEARTALQRLPKSELHVHLRGAIPQRVLRDLYRKYDGADVLVDAPNQHIRMFERSSNIAPFLLSSVSDAKYWDGLFRYEGLDQLLATYCFIGYYIRELTDFAAMLEGVICNFRTQGIRYAEITVALSGYLKRGLPFDGLLTCMRSAMDHVDIQIQWIVDLVRNNGPEGARQQLDEVLAHGRETFVGITLGGDERTYPPAQFSNLYRHARSQGLRLTVHAGEGLGPSSVWDALFELGTERIGHGVRSVEDRNLVQYLATRQIPLEICVTSNVRTRVYRTMDNHPVRHLIDCGIPITINTDDPTLFATDLTSEYMILLEMGVAPQDILSSMRNGFLCAFLPPNQIDEYVRELETAWERCQLPELLLSALSGADRST